MVKPTSPKVSDVVILGVSLGERTVQSGRYRRVLESPREILSGRDKVVLGVTVPASSKTPDTLGHR
jgi:hypothetical protein